MNVFVTGATGVQGRRVLALLLARGDRVRGLARSDDNAAAIERAGAEAARGDLFDPDFLTKATSGCDTILHLATRIPPVSRAWRRRAWADNDRIRVEGTRLLAGAAKTNGIETLVFPSITFGYVDGGEEWIDESVEWDGGPALATTAQAEHTVAGFTEAGGRGIVLRNALFHAPEATSTDAAVQSARLGLAPVFGPGDGYRSSLWADDAASAAVAALRAPAGTYNVADEEPLEATEYAAAVAAGLSKRRLRPAPRWMLRATGTDYMSRSQRISNRRFKEATGWAPTVRDARDMWVQIGRARGFT